MQPGPRRVEPEPENKSQGSGYGNPEIRGAPKRGRGGRKLMLLGSERGWCGVQGSHGGSDHSGRRARPPITDRGPQRVMQAAFHEAWL